MLLLCRKPILELIIVSVDQNSNFPKNFLTLNIFSKLFLAQEKKGPNYKVKKREVSFETKFWSKVF